MDLKVTVEKKASNFYIVSLAGSLDTNTHTLLQEEVDKIMGEAPNTIALDMAQLEYISSAGLRVILLTIKELRTKDGKVVLCSLNEYVQEVFDVSNFVSIIPITASSEEGIQLLSQV